MLACPGVPIVLATVSLVAGADPEARVLGRPVCTWLGVRVSGEDGFLPEPGQVSPPNPGAERGRRQRGVRATRAPAMALAAQSGSGLALQGWLRQDEGRDHLGCGRVPETRPKPLRGCFPQTCTGHTSWSRARATVEGMRGGWQGARGATCPLLRWSVAAHAFLCRFWNLLTRYLPTHSICSLPFVTSFCLGLGTRRVCYGQVCGSPCWVTGGTGLPFLRDSGPHLGEVVAAWASVRGRGQLCSVPCSCPRPAFLSRRRRWGPGTTQAPSNSSPCLERTGWKRASRAG